MDINEMQAVRDKRRQDVQEWRESINMSLVFNYCYGDGKQEALAEAIEGYTADQLAAWILDLLDEPIGIPEGTPMYVLDIEAGEIRHQGKG